jgi:hypothetical protein
MSEPAAGPRRLLGEDALGDAVSRLTAVVRPRSTVEGWATVELDRAQEEVAAGSAASAAATVSEVADDRVLGARCRLVRFADGQEVILLEPSIEGRLAAALARHGEGTVVRFLLADRGATERARRAGFTVSSEGRGPFGPERLVVDGPRSGPFLLIAGLD